MRLAHFAALLLVACTGGDTRPATAAPPAPEQPAPAPAAPAASAAACEDDLPDVVAQVNGQPITRAELEGAARVELIAARAALIDAQRAALESMIIERLIKAETTKRGIDEQGLLAQEVEAKIVPATEAEINAFYEQNRDQMQGAPIEEMRPRIAAYLEQQQGQELTRALIDRLRAEAGVKTLLKPLHLDGVTAKDSARKGPATAPIEIIEYSDFQCPYCTMAAETVKKVQEKYGDKVSVVYRHFPLPMHRQAGLAAQASECANDQGKFWEFHDALFADQKPWTQDDLVGYAKKNDLKVKDFEECLTTGKHAATVEEDMEDGRQVGMSGTPGFYVNGYVLSGAQPVEAFSEVIDAELARLGG